MPTEPDPTEVSHARAAAPAPAPAEFAGVVTSRNVRVISAQVHARIEKLAVRSGQSIKAGELVATLDKTEVQNRLKEAVANEKAAVAAAGAFGGSTAALRDKMIAESRLLKLGASSAIAVTSARAEYARIGAEGSSAMEKASAARALREQAENDLAKTEIVAPISGIVTQIKAHEGQVPPDGTPLARVFDPSRLIVRFAVPREHRSKVVLGQRVVLVTDDDRRDVPAHVTSISGAQEPPINFTVVEADLDDTKLAPGLTVASTGRVHIDPTGENSPPSGGPAGKAVGVPTPRDRASPIADPRGARQ